MPLANSFFTNSFPIRYHKMSTLFNAMVWVSNNFWGRPSWKKAKKYRINISSASPPYTECSWRAHENLATLVISGKKSWVPWEWVGKDLLYPFLMFWFLYLVYAVSILSTHKKTKNSFPFPNSIYFRKLIIFLKWILIDSSLMDKCMVWMVLLWTPGIEVDLRLLFKMVIC